MKQSSKSGSRSVSSGTRATNRRGRTSRDMGTIPGAGARVGFDVMSCPVMSPIDTTIAGGAHSSVGIGTSGLSHDTQTKPGLVYGVDEVPDQLLAQSDKLVVRKINKLPGFVRDMFYTAFQGIGLSFTLFLFLPFITCLWFLSFVDYILFDSSFAILRNVNILGGGLKQRSATKNYEYYQPCDRPPLFDLHFMIFNNFDTNTMGKSLKSLGTGIISGIMTSLLLIGGRIFYNGIAQRYFGKLRLVLLNIAPKYRNNFVYAFVDKALHLVNMIEYAYYVAASSSNFGAKYVLGNWSNYGNIFAAGYSYASNSNEMEYNDQIEDYYVPFMSGIGILDYNKCLEYIQSKFTYKTNNIFMMNAPLVQRVYYPLSGIAFDTKSELHSISRDTMWIFLSNSYFKQNIGNNSFYIELQNVARLNNNDKVDDINKACIRGMYYSIFGVAIDEDYITDKIVELEYNWRNSVSPSWMNFLTQGCKNELKLEGLINEVMNNIFIPKLSTSIIDQLYDLFKDKNMKNLAEWPYGNDPDLSVYFMINNFFLTSFAASLGGLYALVNVTISKLRENPREYIPLYKENPIAFMLECARMETSPNGVTIELERDEYLNIGGYKRKIAKGTLATLFANVCHMDPNVFDQPLLFNPKRNNLTKILNFSALESDMAPFNVLNGQNNAGRRDNDPRSCPGHDIGLIIGKNMVDTFVCDEREPSQANLYRYSEYDEDVMERIVQKIPVETRGMLQGAKGFLTTWIRLGPQDISIQSEPPTKLETLEAIPGVNVPLKDEDLDKSLQDRLGILGAGAVLVPMKLKDVSYTFSSAMQGGEFRDFFFGDYWPAVNVDWPDYASDKSQSLIAFYGPPAYLTRKYKNEDFDFLNGVIKDSSSSSNNSGGSEDVKSSEAQQGGNGSNINDIYWVCESRELAEFETRDDSEFMRLGASAYFNEKRELIGIYCSDENRYYMLDVNCNETKWLHLKWLWRCSLLVKMTLHEHLIGCHFKFANGLDIASRETLSSNHPIRRFMKPFKFRTSYVNWSAIKELINEGGLVHRGFCYDYPTLVKILGKCMDMWEFEFVEDHFKNNGFSKKEISDTAGPVFNDAVMLFRIHKNYLVKPYVTLYYKDNNSIQNDSELIRFINRFLSVIEYENHSNLMNKLNYDKNYFYTLDGFIDLLSQIIVTVTGLHELLGNFVEFKMRPDGYCGKVRRNVSSRMADIQSYAQLITLGAFTGGKTPGLLNDFTGVLLKDKYHGDAVNAFKTWQKQLFMFRDNIESKNKNKSKRIQPCNSFNPTYLECSVSI